MLARACGELLSLKNVVVINDEAHHCYREREGADEEGELKGDYKDEAKENNEAARLRPLRLLPRRERPLQIAEDSAAR